MSKEHVSASVEPHSSISTHSIYSELPGCSSHHPEPCTSYSVVKDMSRQIKKICSLISTFWEQIIKICNQIPQVHEKLTNKFCILISLMSKKLLNKSVKLYSLARGQTVVWEQWGGPELILLVSKYQSLKFNVRESWLILRCRPACVQQDVCDAEPSDANETLILPFRPH